MISPESLVFGFFASLAFEFVMADAPEHVMPVIAFFEVGVSSPPQLGAEWCILTIEVVTDPELLVKEIAHDRDLHFIPVVAKLDGLPDFLGLRTRKIRVVLQCEDFSFLWVKGFCRLIGVLG